MTKTLAEAQITTAKARSKLELGVHWRRLDAEAHLGYRKGKRSGVWFVRWRNHHDGANYKQAPVGIANDVNDKLAEGTLTFEQAVTQAREHVTRSRIEAAAQAAGPAPTVRMAVETYIRERNARDSRRAGREVRSDAGHRLRRYVLGQEERGSQEAIEAAPLAAVHLHALREDDLLTWREDLPVELKATTKQRLINDLKAGLNAAWPRLSAEQKKLNPAFPSIVKDGFNAERIDDDDETSVARDNQVLSDAQISTLLQAAREIDDEQGFEGDLHRIVVCLAATGARFAQARRMRVSDAQREEQRLMVPGSYKGRVATVAPFQFRWRRCHRSPLASHFRSPKPGAVVREMELRAGGRQHRLEKVRTRSLEDGRTYSSVARHPRSRSTTRSHSLCVATFQHRSRLTKPTPYSTRC